MHKFAHESPTKTPTRRKLCCFGFAQAVENCDLHGWSIYATELAGKPTFFICFRGLSFDDFEKRSATKGEPDGDRMPVAVGSEFPISFCPWCGVRLSRRYRKTWRNFLPPSDRGFYAWCQERLRKMCQKVDR